MIGDKEKAVTVYFDDHLKGHAFFYKKPNDIKAVVSDGVYDRLDDCESSAYLCLFADTSEIDIQLWDKHQHCKTVYLH